MTTAENNTATSDDATPSLAWWPSATCHRCGMSMTEPTDNLLVDRLAKHYQECAELQADSSAPGFSTRSAALYAAVNLSAAHTASEGRLSTGMVLRVAKVFEDYLAGRATSSGEDVGA